MRVRTHLIAMPWGPPESPSIQIASLKAHLARAMGREGDCRAYSAFFSILHEARGPGLHRFYRAVGPYGEYAYLTLYLRRFGPPELRGRAAIRRLVHRLRKPSTRPLSLTALDGLERATRRFLDRRVGPSLIARGLNLVGFTLNYDQVYASLYAAEHLRRTFPDRRFLFVYGGCGASLPNVHQLLSDLRVPGVVVVGEGERKLELLVRTLQALPPAEARNAPAAVAGLDPGIVAIGEKVDLGSRDPARHTTQIEDLGQLALPDYDEYFSALRSACRDHRTYSAFRASTLVLVEGSRGCFRRCDFCGLNRTWRGYRTRTGEQVLDAALALTRRYRTSNVEFADSVCDAWAEDYARRVVQAGIRQRSPMELRADHPERFWTLLALAGVTGIQVGIEALSSPLLRAMGKGTSVIQNLAAHKCFAELGIETANNLIACHPASTLADIRETRRILRQIPHWGPFRPVRFALMAGSALYEGLTSEERASLRPVRSFRLPPRAARYAVDYSFEVPAKLQPPPRVRRAWNAFAAQYQRDLGRHRARRPRLDVVRVAPEALRITDTRRGRPVLHELSGTSARIYDACHPGADRSGIARATGFSPRTVEAGLGRLVRSKLVLRVDGHYMALALRGRDELLRGLLAAGGLARPPGVGS